MSVLLLPAEETLPPGEGEQSRNVAPAGVSATRVSFLIETVFTPERNNEVTHTHNTIVKKTLMNMYALSKLNFCSL